jgi:hypothetical protein
VEESLLANVWKSTIGESPTKMERFRAKGVPPLGNRNFQAPTNAPRPDDNRARIMMNTSNNIIINTFWLQATYNYIISNNSKNNNSGIVMTGT